MTLFSDLLSNATHPLVVPGAHDALSARLIEDAGFTMAGIGGSGLSATQLGLPDIGVQSFGEYRDAIGRIVEATRLPIMVDGENGFGDAKAIVRTVRTFERMGIAALAIEDLDFPPRLDQPPSVISADAMIAKIRAATTARLSGTMAIIARTDAAYAGDSDEAIRRARAYQDAGADAILAVGMPGLDALHRLRDAVAVPLIVLCVPGSPWYAPTLDEVRRVGAEAVIYPATILLHTAAGIAAGITAIAEGGTLPPSGFGFQQLAAALRVGDWAQIDRGQ